MDKQKKNHANKLRLIAETLEARVLYSADSLSVLGSALLQDFDDANADHADAFAHLDYIQIPTVEISEVVFIDSRVPEYQSIVDDINQHKSDSALVIVIDSSENGVEVIEQTLADLQGVDAVHVISHSLGDSVRLGSEYLSIDTIDQHQQSIVTWGDALSADADILFYGCDIGSTDSGIELMNSLAALTGADIGLTENKTGTTQTGTDWEFEVSSGPLEYSAVVSYELQQSWNHALYNWDAGTRVLRIDYLPDKFNDNFTYGPGGGKSVIQNLLDSAVTESDEISLREAVYASNLVADPANGFTIQLLDETYIIADGSGDFGAGTQKDLEVTNNLTIQGTSETGTILQVATSESRAFTIDAENYSIAISNLTIKDGSISSDSFSQGGGAIRIAEGSTVLTDVTLDGNQAKKGGGIYIYGGTLDLVGGHIIGNSAYGTAPLQGTGGGVLTSINLSETSINGTFFQVNTAYSWGGAIATYSPASIINAEFQGNSSYGTSNNDGGGAIAAIEDITIVDTLINNNNSAEFGGGVVALAELNISDSIISNNTAGTFGGGVYTAGNSSTISSSTIDSNDVNTNSGGGIIVTSSGDLTIDDSVITNNTALASTSTNGYGAGIIVEGKLNLNNSTVAFNQARAFGGIGAFGSSELNVYRTTFFENDADEDGGAIGSGDDADVTIVNASLVGNKAHDEGSAIYKANNSTVTVANSIMDRGGHRPAHSLLFNENLTAGGIDSNGYNLITGDNDIDPVNFPDVFDQHHTDLVSKNIDNKDFDANLDSSLSSVVGSHSQHLTINPGNSAQASSDAVDAGGNFDSNIENPVLGWRDGIVNVDPFGNRIDAFVDIGAVEYVHPVQPTKLFWIDKSDNSIWRMNADATGVQEIVPQGSQHGELREYIDLDYDPNTGTLFTLQSYNTATTTYEITYVNADGSTPDDMTPLVFQGTGYSGANPTAPRAIDIVPSNNGLDSYLYVAQNTETPSGGLAENYISKFQISIDNADTTSNIASTWNTLQLEITLPTATIDSGTIDSSSQITSLDVSLTDVSNEEIYVFGDAGNNIDYDILTFNPSENINHLYGRDRITPPADDQTVAVYGAEVDKYFLALHSLIEKGPSIYGAYGTVVEDTENSISVSDIAYDYNYDNNMPPNTDEDGRIWFVDDAGKIGHITGTLKDETTILNEGSINPTKIAIASIVAAPLNPTITSDGAGSTSSINVEENQTLVTSVTAIPSALGHALTYEITGGADASLFNIDASNGNLTFLAAQDFETPIDDDTNGVYEVNVRAYDTSGAEDTQQISVTVTDVNESPVITSNGGGDDANINAAENQTAVTSVTATDPDADPDTYTYSLSGADSALFNIDTNGVLTFNNPPDFETDTGSGPSGEFEVTVTVDDGAGGTDSQNLNITLTNVNEDPIITSDGGGDDASINAAENQTAVTSVIANDPDPDPDSYTYSLSGADSALFNIDTNGVLTFNNSPNFETDSGSGPSGEFEVTVTVDDGAGGTDSQNLNITLTDVNEDPIITSNGGGINANISAAENQTAVTSVTATDPDADPDTYTYSLSGADSALFNIDTNGVLTFNNPPDFETDSGSGPSGEFEVTVTVDDGAGGTDSQSLNITLTNVNEDPIITSDGGGDDANINAAENQTAVTSVIANDPDPDPDSYTYSLSGADSALFNIDTNGVLTFNNPPDFETDTGSGPSGEFEVTVTVDDGAGGTDSQNLNISLTNVNEQPVINGGTQLGLASPENQTNIVTVPVVDPDAGDTLTFSIVGGGDQFNISIDPITGALTFNTAPDYENPSDDNLNGVYTVHVRAEDAAGASDTQNVVTTISDTDEEPVITSDGGGDNANINAAENQTAVTTITTVNPEPAPSTLTHTLSGADSALFTVNTSGVLTFINPPDFENDAGSGPNGEFEVTVNVTNSAGDTDSQNLNVILTDVNDQPEILGGQLHVVNTPENQTSILTVPAQDQDAGDSLNFSITGGADQSNFSIDPLTGELSFNVEPDFENPTDADADGEYNIRVTVEDLAGELDTDLFDITVTDVNEDPVITSNGGGDTANIDAAENQTAVTSVVADDPDADPDTYTYSLSGADSALFNIDTNGVLTFNTAPDFETDAGSGLNGEFEVTVTVDDGSGGTDSQNLNVSLTNLNEAPTITAAANPERLDTPENQTSIMTVPAVDPDAGDTLTYSIVGGSDQSNISIDSVTGALTFNELPDFENPIDSNINGKYTIHVQVEDAAGATVVQTFVFTITDVNENPIITSDGGGNDANINAPENQTAVTSIIANDPDTDPDTYNYSLSGADSALFNIDTNGVLSFINAPDFETDAGSGVNGEFEVTVTVDDGSGGTDSQNLNVTLDNVNEDPVIISNGGLDNANISAAENQTAVTSIVANDPDPDPDTFVYSLSGSDSSLFNIDTNGILTFINPPDFETESGSGSNGEYVVTVKVNDAEDASDAQTLSILVTDENETPSNLTLSENTVNEIIDSTSGITIGLLSSIEQDSGDTISYSIIGGEDADVFTVGGVAGNELILTDGVLDYETQSVYSVQVRASDAAGLYVDQSFDININPINEAPLAGSDLPDQVATELELFTYTIPLDSFSDPENDALTYSVISELPAWLNYDEQSRTLSGTPSDADVNDGPVSIEIQASDQELQSTTTKFLNIELVDINQNPIDIALEIPASPDRNDPYLIGALTTTDPDINDSHAYTITDERFEIVGDELRFAPNAETNFFENEIVELEVVATDSGELTTSQSFTIQVSDYLTISVPPALGAAELTVAETPTQVEPEPTTEPTTTSTNDTEPAQPKPATAELTQEPENQQNNTDVEDVDLASLIAPLEKITLEEIALLQNSISPLSGKVSANQLSADLNNRLDFEFDTGFDYANSSEFREMAVEFDRQREELEETQAQYKTLIGSSFTLSSGLSVGYLLWLIRGGTLMGSVLSSLPAWRMVDPLPVLGSLGDDAFEDEESLETMVDDDPEDPTGEADKEAA